MRLSQTWLILPAVTFALAALASIALIAVAGTLTIGGVISIAASLPMGLVGLNERWSESIQWFFYWHPIWVSVLVSVLAYAVHAALAILARHKGVLPFVILEILIIINGIGLFRMCLLHGLN